MLSVEYNEPLIQGEVERQAVLRMQSLVPRGGREWRSAFPKRVHENDQNNSLNHENAVLVLV